MKVLTIKYEGVCFHSSATSMLFLLQHVKAVAAIPKNGTFRLLLEEVNKDTYEKFMMIRLVTSA
jgi:hypothetical protein